MAYLPYDYSRCEGVDHPLCQGCLRKLPGGPKYQSFFIPPPAIIFFSNNPKAVDESSCQERIVAENGQRVWKQSL